MFWFSQHFPGFPTYHKIPNCFPISRPGGDPESNYRVKIWHVIYSSNKNQLVKAFSMFWSSLNQSLSPKNQKDNLERFISFYSLTLGVTPSLCLFLTKSIEKVYEPWHRFIQLRDPPTPQWFFTYSFVFLPLLFLLFLFPLLPLCLFGTLFNFGLCCRGSGNFLLLCILRSRWCCLWWSYTAIADTGGWCCCIIRNCTICCNGVVTQTLWAALWTKKDKTTKRRLLFQF